MEGNIAKQAIEKVFDPKETKELLVRACQLPTAKTELYERDPNIHKYIQDFIQPEFEEVGIDTCIDDYGNLIVEVGEGITGRRLLIIQHSMSWMVGTMKNPWSGEVLDGKRYGVEGEIVRGRGAGEEKGSCIAAVAAAKTVARSGLTIPGKVIFAVTSGGHQASSDNIFHLLYNDEIRADMAVHVGRPQITLGGIGRIDLKLAVYGTPAHSSRPEEGKNAVDGALIALDRLKKITPHPNQKHDPELGNPRLTITGLASYPQSPGFPIGLGSGGHTLQRLVRIMIDRRILPTETVDEAIEEIRDAIGDLSPYKYKIERGAYHYPWKVDESSPIVRKLSESVGIMLGKEPEYIYTRGAWDYGYLNKVGIPCVAYGALGPAYGNVGPHSDNDFAVVNWVCNAAKVYAHLALVGTST